MPADFAFDFETWPIDEGFPLPPAVCLSLASRERLEVAAGLGIERQRDGVWEYLIGNDDPSAFGRVLESLLSEGRHAIGAGANYDWGVALYDDPERLIAPVFDAGEDGRLHDVVIAEKLLRLSTTGNLEGVELPDGSWKALEYNLARLAADYTGADRTESKASSMDKTRAGDEWRLHFPVLDKWSAGDYPDDAIEYAIDDSRDTLLVWEHQQARANASGHESMGTEPIQTLADLCLKLMTAHGLRVDVEQVKRLEEAIAKQMSPEKHQPLYDAGLLIPGEPERVRRTRTGDPMIRRRGPDKGKPIMVAAKPEKRCDKAIRQYIADLCESKGLAPKLTATDRISMDADTVSMLAPLDDSGLLNLFAERQRFEKLRSTYLPVLRDAHTVWPGYNVLVSTGRTSSKGFPKGRALYRSCNIQNIPRVEEGNLNVRACFVPRPGHLLVSIDFSALELCSFAQTTYELFGWSVHRDKLAKGYDMHAFLGAQIAAALDPEFAEECSAFGIDDPDDIYEHFVALKADPELRAKFKHYRTFAKPTGLGYPGGLGPDTFIQFARQTYGVQVDKDTAIALRNLWYQTYPEGEKYLREVVPIWTDPFHANDPTGGHCYESPLGMYRANANYCATANGRALQTPSAEGAKLAIIDCSRRCIDATQNDPLFGSSLWAYVHDEIIFEFPEETAFELGPHAAKLMVDAMSVVMPDVQLGAEPAYMRRWIKGAEPEFHEDGRPKIYDLKDGEVVTE